MKWLLLQYELPNEPSKYRVWVWRRLKKQSAFKLLDGLYCLPYTDNSLERFNWLCSEIEEMGGRAMLWASEALLEGQETEIIREKEGVIRKKYEALCNEILRTMKTDYAVEHLEKLSQIWADIKWHDTIDHPLGEKAKELLTEMRISIRRKKK